MMLSTTTSRLLAKSSIVSRNTLLAPNALVAHFSSKGTVKWFNVQKGFGFIIPEDGGPDLFVHQTAIHAEGFRSLAQGEAIEYEIMEDEQGRPKASRVTGPGGSFVQGAPPHTVRPYAPPGSGGYGGFRDESMGGEFGLRGGGAPHPSYGYGNQGGYGIYGQQGNSYPPGGFPPNYGGSGGGGYGGGYNQGGGGGYNQGGGQDSMSSSPLPTSPEGDATKAFFAADDDAADDVSSAETTADDEIANASSSDDEPTTTTADESTAATEDLSASSDEEPTTTAEESVEAAEDSSASEDPSTANTDEAKSGEAAK